MRVNCDGSRVAILADQVEGSLKVKHPDPKIHVYDRNKGAMNTFDFATFKRYPISIGWDEHDNRILVCETARMRVPVVVDNSNNSKGRSRLYFVYRFLIHVFFAGSSDAEIDSEFEIYTFFVTSECGILMQDSFPRSRIQGSLLGYFLIFYILLIIFLYNSLIA